MNFSLTSTGPSPLELAIAEAQHSGNFKNFWQQFLQTRFEVALQRSRNTHADPLDFLVQATPQKTFPSLQIAEDILTLDQHHQGVNCESLTGAELIKLVPEQLGIAVLLKNRMMSVSPERVSALRKSQLTQQTSTTKAEKAPISLAKPEPAPAAPLSLVTEPRPAVILSSEISTLKPRQVEVAELGLEMFIPGAWQENKLSRRMKISDTEHGTIIDVRGRPNDGLSLAQWREMRLAELHQDFPGLQSHGEITAINRGEWSGLIQASTQEFQGMVGEDRVDSKLLLCCYRLEDMLVSILVRARTPVFDAQQAIYKWMVNQVTILPPLNLPEAELAEHEQTAKFSLISFSAKGRIGRIQFIIHSFFSWLLPLGISLLAYMLLHNSPTLLAIIVTITFTICSVFPIVRRLHDMNLSGKWLLLPPLLFALAAVGSLGKAVISPILIIVSLAMLVGFLGLFLVPGNKEENNYGHSPGQPGAGSVILAVLIIIASIVSTTTSNRYYEDYANKLKANQPVPAELEQN